MPYLLPYLFVIFATEAAQVMWTMGQLGILGLFLGGTIESTSNGAVQINSVTFEWAGLVGSTRTYFVAAPWVILVPATSLILCIFAFRLLAYSIRKRLEKNQIYYEY